MVNPELNDLNYRLVNNLFDKNYILLSAGMITDFVHWVDKVKSDFEENGIEVLNSIYIDSTVVIAYKNIVGSREKCSYNRYVLITDMFL